jgi:trehalose utilization protein
MIRLLALLWCLGALCRPALAAEAPPVRVLVWDEQQPAQKTAYDGGFLGDAIATHLAKQPGFKVVSVNFASPNQGLSDAELDAAQVVVWWGHVKHALVETPRVEALVQRVRDGRLALVALHSAHWARPFVRLMQERAKDDALAQIPAAARATAKFEFFNDNPLGKVPRREAPLTPALRQEDGVWKLTLPGCIFPAYRNDGAPSHVKTLLPDHPIARGLPAAWDIPATEMYDEPFHVPAPEAVVFEERWDKGEHFRSGSLWKVGKGGVFYYRPGHETHPVFKQAENLRVVENAARYLAAQLPADAKAAPPAKAKAAAPSGRLALPHTENFTVADRPAFLYLPPPEKRASPQPWIFYAPTLPSYPDNAERWMHEQFTAAGIAVAGVDVGEAYGSPKSHAAFDALYRELAEKKGFAAKPCLFGRSRGGLWTSSWAIANPSRVAGLIGIYPVYDFRTFPGLQRAAPAYELTPEQLTARAAEFNPIERIAVLAKAKVPVALIHGDVDKVVPLKENSAELVRRYQAEGAGDLVKLIVLEGQGHNFFEGFFHSQPLVDFAIAKAKEGARK